MTPPLRLSLARIAISPSIHATSGKLFDKVTLRQRWIVSYLVKGTTLTVLAAR